VLGAQIAKLNAHVRVACVYEPATVTKAELSGLVVATAADLGCAMADESSWSVSDAPLGEGYGIPTEAGQAAIELLATTEGVLLDPVYTGKAFGYLLSMIAQGQLDDQRDVVFVHTGGSPGLFAYAPAFAD
jgi:1-aminocyclopropane-1-carboxylate deaminase/D-cysteine desulfhydrase-like pyridoxal-dependent ACC family enzyme